MTLQTENRYERGAKALAEIDGEMGQQVIDSLADIAPDFARYIIEFPFGDIYSRPGLDLRAREIATIAALTAMGTARPAGFPAALNGLFVAKEVFDERRLKPS